MKPHGSEHRRSLLSGGAELDAKLEKHRSSLLRVARVRLSSSLHCKVSPSDIVQQTFLEALRDKVQLRHRNTKAVRAWLRTIVFHKIANVCRKFHGTEKHNVERECPLPDGSSDLRLAAPGRSLSSEVRDRERYEQLIAAVEQLPPDYRDVLLMKYRDHLTMDEIAAVLQRSRGAVRKLWSRALFQLTQRANGQGNESEAGR